MTERIFLPLNNSRTSEMLLGVSPQYVSRILSGSTNFSFKSVAEPKKGKKNRKCGHLKMKVVQNLKSSTLESEAAKSIDTKAMVVIDNLRSHAGVEKVVAASE